MTSPTTSLPRRYPVMTVARVLTTILWGIFIVFWLLDPTMIVLTGVQKAAHILCLINILGIGMTLQLTADHQQHSLWQWVRRVHTVGLLAAIILLSIAIFDQVGS